ncbi:CU044_5270 family protein [Streptosporangium sp. NPDC020145]|uniref:CU044_5270 family protein n=1 Tax=Streptosporangium sp. NPDC020145 TaxID=3154694 RepID=UPI00344390AA
MDELETLRELYGEPRPDPILKAKVRQALDAEAGRPRLRFVKGITGVLAATATVGTVVATAVAVAVVVTGATTAGPGRAPSSAASPYVTESATGSGRSILLAAAVTAEADVAADGPYWHVSKLNRRTYPESFGRDGDRYRVVESRLTEQWVAEDGDGIWVGTRSLGARPAGEADEEAWRRDGSPATWPVPGGTLSAAPDRGRLRAVTDGTAFSMAGKPMTLEQIRALPTDPGALREQVADLVRDAPGGSLDGVVADALSGLLWSKPSPPKVRAAAYRALADLPEVRYLGETKDERGRAGAAFSFTLQTAGATRLPVAVRRTLVIDPVSSQVLSSTVTGKPGNGDDQVEVVLEAGWTTGRPAVPALPVS